MAWTAYWGTYDYWDTNGANFSQNSPDWETTSTTAEVTNEGTTNTFDSSFRPTNVRFTVSAASGPPTYDLTITVKDDNGVTLGSAAATPFAESGVVLEVALNWGSSTGGARLYEVEFSNMDGSPTQYTWENFEVDTGYEDFWTAFENCSEYA